MHRSRRGNWTVLPVRFVNWENLLVCQKLQLQKKLLGGFGLAGDDDDEVLPEAQPQAQVTWFSIVYSSTTLERWRKY